MTFFGFEADPSGVRDAALPLLLCALLVLSGCSLLGGTGTPTAEPAPTATGTPTPTPAPTFGPSVYDAADAAASGNLRQ